MVPPIDERGPALKLLDEEAEEMALIRIIYPFYTSLGDDATAISLREEDGLDEMVIVLLFEPGETRHTAITKSSCTCCFVERPTPGPFGGSDSDSTAMMSSAIVQDDEQVKGKEREELLP